MKNNISLTLSIKPVIHFIRRFHGIIFFLFVSVGLFLGIYSLLPVINIPETQPGATGEAVDASFDQATIERLRSGESKKSSYTPGERKSPFNE